MPWEALTLKTCSIKNDAAGNPPKKSIKRPTLRKITFQDTKTIIIKKNAYNYWHKIWWTNLKKNNGIQKVKEWKNPALQPIISHGKKQKMTIAKNKEKKQ